MKKYNNYKNKKRYNRNQSKADKALKIAYSLRRNLTAERKNFDTTISASPSSVGVITHLTAIPQGDTSASRDGDSCKLISLHMKTYASIHASASNTLLRYIIFQDKQTTGSAPSVTTVLENANVNSFRNLVYGKRFKILTDKLITLRQDGYDMVTQQINHKLQMTLRYDATATSPSSNPYYLLLLSNEAINFPAIGGYCRVRFVDN